MTAAGALLGLLVGGVGGRLAMMLLAQLNPEVHGRDSDDGFEMGQVSGATFNLLFVAMLIGILGGAIYLALTLFSNAIIGRVERWARRGMPSVAGGGA